MKQKQLKTRKQDGSLSITSRQTIQVLKEKETYEKKVEKGVKEKNVFDTPCESNIKTVVEEISHKKIPRYSSISVNLQRLSTIDLFSNRRSN